MKKRGITIKNFWVGILILILVCLFIALAYFLILYFTIGVAISIFGKYTQLALLIIIDVLMTAVIIKGIKKGKVPLFQFGARLKHHTGVNIKKNKNKFFYWFVIIAYVIFIILTFSKLISIL